MRRSMNGRFQEYFGRVPFRTAGFFTARPAGRIALSLGLCLVQLFFFLTLAAASEGAEGGHEGRNWVDFGWRAFDFAALVGFFYWLLAEKTRNFFSGRRDGLKQSLEQAAVAKDEAARKLRESTERLEKAAGEIKEATESIRQQGLREKERIVADARKAAEKMKDDARKRLEQEFRQASNLLKAEAVDLSMKLSEEILKKNIGEQDHNAMVRDYIDKVLAEGQSPKQQ
jgi:F-type H+-transporting ATPase subunit b